MADLPTKLNLMIVTRERKIVETQVDEVILPGYDGELGILPGHTPLLALLKIGEQRRRAGVGTEDKSVNFAVRLSRGATTLQTWFRDADGREIAGAYFVYVRAL